MKDRAYKIITNPIYDGYKRGLATMVCKCFYKKTGWGAEGSVNEELGQELHKPLTENLRRRKVYFRFKGNIWGTDLAEMA